MDRSAVHSAQKGKREEEGTKGDKYRIDISLVAQTQPLSHLTLQTTEMWKAESSRRSHFIGAFIFNLCENQGFQE